MTVLSYLWFNIKDEHLPEFHQDTDDMMRLAKNAPGFQWAQILRDESDRAVHVILSEWDSRDDMRAWEHSTAHEAIMDKYEDRYAEPMRHRRFVPE